MTRSRMGLGLAALGLIFAIGCTSAGSGDDERPSAARDRAAVVPDLVGDTMDTVYDQLQGVGLVASASDLLGGGGWTEDHVVLTTSPAAGAEVQPGSTVKIFSATKAQIVFYAKPMPKLVGRKWLYIESGSTEGVSLLFKTRWRNPKGKEKPGTIVGQEPKAGTSLKIGQAVTITVADYTAANSTGGANVDLPNVDLPNVCRRTKWC